MSRRISNPILTRVRQVASPHKMAKVRLERTQKINKVSKSLFGPVIKSEFRSFAQMEMKKYQVQASQKWGFDFVNESPIVHTNNTFHWESAQLNGIPKFYHHITKPNRMHSPSATSSDVNECSQLFSECENICPLSQNISTPSIIVQKPMTVKKRMMVASTSSAIMVSAGCGNQTKITDYLKVRKRRMSATSAVCLKKARADF